MMGTYNSKPITEKVSEDGQSNFLNYGSSAMQGWRIDQEDAHNTILDYDENKSFFAVYDGHGGHEVATYTAEHYPKFLKSSESFKKSDFTVSLKETFLSFDETLITPEVQTTLKEIAKTNEEELVESDDEREEVDNLYREASMPLSQVMEQYSKPKNEDSSNTKSEDDCPDSTKSAATSSSSQELSASGSGLSKQDTCKTSKSTNGQNTSDSISPEVNSVSPTKGGSEIVENGNNSSGKESPAINGEDAHIKSETNGDSLSLKNKIDLNLSSDSSIKSENIKSVKEEVKSEKESELKSDIKSEKVDTKSDIVKSDLTNNISGSPNGSSPKGNSVFKGKGKSLTKKPNQVSSDKASTEKTDKRLIQKRKAAEKAELIYKEIQTKELPDDEEDEDDLDEEIEEDEDDDDEDENEESMGWEDVEEDEDQIDEESSESEMEEEDDDESTYNEFSMNMREESGYDSGCTACVVLLHDSSLSVANVGDSRCVVCRDGKAIDMSIDHKPEDKEETDRIVKAGGKITRDKRVNGGLNLSRAIGDHSYKQNKSLKAEEQMISPMPDVRTLDLSPEDSFMIIACDGIWNSLSSQEAVDFVSSRLKPDTKLSSICEEMFDHCLAPNVFGDGTGCDNMTCIIVRFNHNSRKKREIETSQESEAPVEKKQKVAQ